MKSIHSVILIFVVYTAVAWMAPGAYPQSSTPKKKIIVETDLPRITYPAVADSWSLVNVDDATFKPFLDRFAKDLDSVFSVYDIEDKATLRTLLADKEAVQILRGDLTGTVATVEQERVLLEKPATRAMFTNSRDPLLAAWRSTGRLSGAAFLEAYAKASAATLQSLNWAVVEEQMKSSRASCGLDTTRDFEGILKRQDQDTRKSGTMTFSQASTLVEFRLYNKVFLPGEPQYCSALNEYVQAHTTSKADIWAAREIDFTTADKLTPVNIAIWDSGVDSKIYASQMYTDPNPGSHGPHGLAFDTQGMPLVGDLQPLTPEQQQQYPKFLELRQGFDDLREGVASPAAEAARRYQKETPPEKMMEISKIDTFLAQYVHGTHVAGISVHGNPAARLVVMQFNDGLANLPFAPTVEWANRFKADFAQIGDYLREHNVRVVNISWSDSVSEFEEWLAKTNSEKDPAVRKQTAEKIYSIWKDAVQGAMMRAPNTLFFCAAGNSDSDASFNGDVPASLHLPNLVTVGAVDQAGDETTFTSYGNTVVLDADGFQVLSFLPGGSQARLSGTSMASPNAANLAAKLIAVDPSLTPSQVVGIMKRTADASTDGRLHLINPRAAMADLKQRSQ